MTRLGADQPTQVLADYFTAFQLSDVPDEVQDRAKRILLDTIVCALSADRSEETALVADAALAMGSQGEATILGAAERQSLGAACLLNGFRVTAMTACDVYRPAHCHITPEVVPPALAIAEREGTDGADLLIALVAGLETSVRVARGMVTDEFKRRRWHAPGIVGPFGGAVAAGRLLRQDSLTMRNAMAIAGSQASGTYVAHGTPTVKFHQAHGALAGLLGALLASGGLKGAAEVLAGPDGGLFSAYAGGGDSAAVTDGLGEEWEMGAISLRLWPGGTYIQPPLTTADRLVRESRLDFDEIAQVVIRVAPSVVASQAKYSRPQGTFECLASVEYTVTSMLRWKTVSLDHFSPDFYNDKTQRRFLEDRVEMVADENLSPLECVIEVTNLNGSIATAESRIPKGHPDHWLTWEELTAKTHDFGRGTFEPAILDDLVDRVRNLEREDSIATILALTRP